MLKQISTLDGYEIAIASPGAFTGGSGERGDKDSAAATTTLFLVNGDVLVRILGVSTVTPIGTNGTLEVGVAGNTAKLIALTTATLMIAGDIWSDASPTVGVDTLASVLGPYLIVNGSDIIETVKTTDLTAGNIYYVCMWRPVSPNSNVIGLPITEGADIRYDS